MVAAPLEPQELLARCDLAGVALVLEEDRNARHPGSIARLKFTKIVKGRVRTDGWLRPRIALVKLRGALSEPIVLGEWSDYYKPGAKVFTHLDWDQDIGMYRTSWWNAVQSVRG